MDAAEAIYKLWSKFTELCHDCDRDQVYPKLELTIDGSGELLLYEMRSYNLVKYPAWAMEQRSQGRWNNLTQGLAVLNQLLKKKQDRDKRPND